jgi:uncharacterized protein YecE (DUF72 family)
VTVVSVRVGLCGWTVAQSSYVRRFPVVEVEHTFYEPPADAVLRRWRTQVPVGIEFTIKAWQVVTHESSSPTYRRLKQPLLDSARGGRLRAFLGHVERPGRRRPSPYVRFNNLPRVGDAERFLALLAGPTGA